MEQREQEYIEIDLLHILGLLIKRIWLIIIVAALVGGIVFGYVYKFVEPKYQSSALFYVNNSSFSVGNTDFSISSTQLSAAQSLVDTYIVILNSKTTLEDVIDKAGLQYNYAELKKMISASSVNSTEIFKVSVESTDPQEAATIANTICGILPKSIANVVDGSDVRIVDYAVVESKRVSPSYTKFTAIGVLAGAIITCLGIVIADMMDDIIHDSAYVTQHYEFPILASIPNLQDSKNKKHYDKEYYNSYSYGYEKGEK